MLVEALRTEMQTYMADGMQKEFGTQCLLRLTLKLACSHIFSLNEGMDERPATANFPD